MRDKTDKQIEPSSWQEFIDTNPIAEKIEKIVLANGSEEFICNCSCSSCTDTREFIVEEVFELFQSELDRREHELRTEIMMGEI